MVSNEIELKRKHLIKTVKEHGLNATETIECSQELDILLIQEIKLSNNHYIKKSEKKDRSP